MPSMRHRITLLAAATTALALAFAGMLLVRSVEDAQVAAVRDRAQDSLELATERLREGEGLKDALIGLDSMVVITDDVRGCFVSNPIDDEIVAGCASGSSSVGEPGAVQGIDEGHSVVIAGLIDEFDGRLADELFAGSSDTMFEVDRDIDEEHSVAVAGSIDELDDRLSDELLAGSSDMMFEVDRGIDGEPDGRWETVVGGVTIEVDGEISGPIIPGHANDPPIVGDSEAPAERFTATVDTERYGELSLAAAAPVSAVARGFESVGAVVWFLFPALVLLAAGSAWWLAGRTLRPVEAIRREADAIGATSLDRRVPQPSADDEIGRLAHTMNAMLDRLERGAQQQRQFISDASHELRSPVAAIRTDLEVALEEGDAADWPATATAVLAEEARLDSLIGDLLILAADDEGGGEVGDDAVDLDLVVAEAAARRRRIAIRVTIEPDRAFVVRGSAGRLERAMANLLDNAARHADERVDIAMVAQGERVVVHVDDDGPGIDPADRERAFERFTRLDEGRARDQGGAGLGLAVARAIVERHGGSITVGDGPLGGARFTVDLPRT